MSSERFYSELPIHAFEVEHIFSDTNHYTHLPIDWYVLCTDVESSTSFYHEGRYPVVNKLAAAGIDIVLRAAMSRNIEVPYVYGGDGILACFPPSLLKPISNDLSLLYQYGHSVCGANLRIGIVPVKDIARAGFDFKISRVGTESTISHTLFDDSAFAWIDNVIKTESVYGIQSLMRDVDISRLKYDTYVLPVWQRVGENYPGEEYGCFIIVPPQNHSNNLELYHRVLLEAERITPRFFQSHPIVSLERDTICSIDFIKTDGCLKLITSGSSEELASLCAILDIMESAGELSYGYLQSKNSIITYIIKESNNYIAGLLDLDDGGYVAAAEHLKSKIVPG